MISSGYEIPEQKGKRLFTFDGEKIFNLFVDYPYNLTQEERKLFDEINPFWADFFKDRVQQEVGMAQYSINKSGAESLQSLRNDLLQSINDIYERSNKLTNRLNGLEDNLGIYYEHIMLENQKVLVILRKALDGDEGVGFLVNTKLPKMIADMEMLIEAGLGDGDGDQKVLSLRRRQLKLLSIGTVDDWQREK